MTVLDIFMGSMLEKHLPHFRTPYLTDGDLAMLLDGSPDSRYSKVKRWLSEGKLLRVCRGLYCLTDKVGHLTKPHPYELAQHIYGPSYISMESALSFHKLIPEAVYTVTNATSKRSKTVHTPLGVFYFHHFPLESLYTGVELVKENGYSFFMAKPWKAICDYVYCYKKEWRSFEPLSESLRIPLESLPLLRDEEIERLNHYYQHQRITRFLKGIKKSMGRGENER